MHGIVCSAKFKRRNAHALSQIREMCTRESKYVYSMFDQEI